MAIIKVGELYLPGRTEYPEVSEYNLYDGGHELRLFIDSPNRNEIGEIRKGRVQVGLLVENRIIFLLYKFGQLFGQMSLSAGGCCQKTDGLLLNQSTQARWPSCKSS
jgi:hypothetical protein